jgi:hypothetical protein
MGTKTTLSTVLILCVLFFITSCHHGGNILENDLIYVELNDDLNGVKSMIDKKTGKEFSGGIDSCLYLLRFGDHYTTREVVSSKEASFRESRRIKNGIELTFIHEGDYPLKITAVVVLPRNSSMLSWNIKISNESEHILNTIEYPVLSCPAIDEQIPTLSGVLYPGFEGVVLTGLNKEGATKRDSYPGKLSAQFMYYFVPQGGVYYAAHDSKGYKKTLNTSYSKGGIFLSNAYLLPIEYEKNIEMPYPVITGIAGGCWEAGASVYRDWAKDQHWCSTRLIDRDDSPEWLKSPRLYINYTYSSPALSSVEKADRIIKSYHDFFDIPVIATGFGWEKNDIWVGGDYFPPLYGEDYYRELSSRLKERGDLLHVFTSGFRWAVRKPAILPDGTTGFTAYDGMEMFNNKVSKFATIDRDGAAVIERPGWAHSYLLCAGDKGARDFMFGVFDHLFDMGIAGVDLDQNNGGEVHICYSDQHGHPVGAGLWMYESMKDFFSQVKANARAKSPDHFIGVEEVCEIYLPYLDVFHGRAYTDTQWPAMGPGAVSVPLFLFLYHPYQVTYSGWIDPGFSALGDERYGLGRAFIFGMFPGVRTTDNYAQGTGAYSIDNTDGKFSLLNGNITEEIKMLKAYTSLMKEFPEFLIHGEMVGETDIEGSDIIDYVAPGRIPLPFSWNEVQGITWISSSGEKTGFALANLSETDSENLKIKAVDPDKTRYEFVYYDYDLNSLIRKEITADGDGLIHISLKPWQLCILQSI